jgi:ring-1,2-phenylacetyl-CoA epoxidase subunit PaaD
MVMTAVAARRRAIDERAVIAALDEVPDPEIPTVSIVELGMIGRVEVDETEIRIELLPTFVGCPALEVIRETAATRLAELGRAVRIDVSFTTPWTTDRISPGGREKLRRSGFAPPPGLRPDRSLPMLDTAMPTAQIVPCPYCGSAATTLENAFGPTQCRSIRHCTACRQPFEAFKAV